MKFKEYLILENVESAENAIRDMFNGKQYNGKVPDKDMQVIIKSGRWDKMYGKGNTKKSFRWFG